MADRRGSRVNQFATTVRSAYVNEALPKMDASSAVCPTARVIGNSLVIAYHLPGCEASAIVRFKGVRYWDYASPNDEGLTKHPLWGKGLTFYEFHEILPRKGEITEWVATFHDGTLTVHADSIEVVDTQVASKPREAIDAQFGPGVNQSL